MLDFSRHPALPPSVGAWEDLLVRYEIAPRALRLAVSDTDPEHEGALALPLGTLLSAEITAGELLKAMRGGSPVSGSGFGVEVVGSAAEGLVERYTDLRAHNFAALQRRGVDVWEWSAPWGDATVTPYRLVMAAVAFDGEMLEAVRTAARGEAVLW